MSQYSVAVIIPCFNASKFIRKTLDSVLNQHYEPLEIIAIDDGSTDGSRNILESYLPNIKILSHTNNANLGQAASINVGIKQTKSELIAFLDSDDIWYPGKVEAQVKIFQTYPEVGLVYTNGHAIDENDKVLYKLFPDEFQEKNIFGKIVLSCYIKAGASSVMVRRELFSRTGYFKEYLQYLDYDMWIRMSEVTKFYYIHDFLMAYRKHPSQQSLKRRQWEEGFIILKEACERYPYGFNLKRKRLGAVHYRLGEYDWNHNNKLRAFRNMFLAGMLDPYKAINFIFYKLKSLYS